MDRQFKKIFSVLIATLVGAGIIFFTWRGVSTTYTETSASGNEWEKSLAVVPQPSTLKTISAARSALGENDATTTSDILARELLANYALVQKGNMSTTTLSEAETMAIAQTAISKIDLPQAKQYTVDDLLLSSDNSSTAIDRYMEEVGALVQTFTLSQTRNDIEVAFVKPGINDTKRQVGIQANIAHYEKLVKGLLSTKTPALLKVPHLDLIQKYANLQASIKPMAEIYTDPLKGLAALATYRKEVADFIVLANEYASYLPKK